MKKEPDEEGEKVKKEGKELKPLTESLPSTSQSLNTEENIAKVYGVGCDLVAMTSAEAITSAALFKAAAVLFSVASSTP